MEIRANINRIDLLKMQYLLLFRMRANYISFGIFYLIIGLISYKQLSEYKFIVGILTLFIIGSFAFLIFFNLIIIIQLITASAEKGWIGETLFRINDESFYEKTAGTETKTNWGAIQKVYKSRNYIFVRINAFRIHIIPRRAFPNIDDYNVFYESLIKKVNNA